MCGCVFTVVLHGSPCFCGAVVLLPRREHPLVEHQSVRRRSNCFQHLVVGFIPPTSTPCRRAVQRQCLCCQKPFRKRGSGRNVGKYCSRECAFEARRLRLPCARLTKRRGTTLDAHLAIWFCSWGNDASDTLYIGESAGGHRKRCIKYGCHFESFAAWRIFERDGWRCQICECDLLPKWTNVGEAETPHPRSPTIDHIVPLSFGPSGPGHRPENVQAACWSCNSKKSDSFDPASLNRLPC